MLTIYTRRNQELRLHFFPIFLFGSTTLSTGMTGISLHMQWPLTSQFHESEFSQESLHPGRMFLILGYVVFYTDTKVHTQLKHRTKTSSDDTMKSFRVNKPFKAAVTW
jgi:hypothetical protein